MMTYWKANKNKTSSTSAGTPATLANSKSGKKCKRNRETDFSFNVADNDEDDDLQKESLSAHLLLPKESTSKEPLFPSSRGNFLMMTCKRTLLGCRGLFLFCFVVFIVISIASSHDRNSADRTNISNSVVSQSISDSSTTSAPNVNQFHHFETILLPPPLTYFGNKSSETLSFNDNCKYGKTDYAVVGNALRKGLEFYEANAETITVLDAALGAKIVAEQLKRIQTSHQNLPSSLQMFLQDLEIKADNLTGQLTATVKRASNGTEELKMTLPWIETDGLWDLPAKKWYPVGSLKSYNPPEEESFEELWNIAAQKEAIDETESDACIYQVFHCESINITENCRKVFLDVERSMYSLTHQVIFMLLAQKNKCYEKPTWKNVTALNENGNPFLERLCGKVWQEANSIADANFPPRFRDLFVEQIGMCSLAGYTDFLRRDWLRRIISWQLISTSGCFGNRRRRVPTTPTEIGTLLQEYQRLREQQPDNPFTHPGSHKEIRKRSKRSDILLDTANDGEKCSVHFTSVGIAALTLHLHYFVDTCLDSY